MSEKADIKAKLKELQGILKTLEDSDEMDAIQAQIEELEKQLPHPTWNKVKKWLAIASGIAGLAYVIIQMIVIFI